MNAFNVCHFIGSVPTHDSFKPQYVAGDEQQKTRSRYSATLSVRRDRKKPDEQYYQSDLIRFVAWGPQADFIHNYAPPGTTIAITGSLNVETVKKDENSSVTYHNIVVDSVRIINSSRQNNQDDHREEQVPKPAALTNPFQKNKAAAGASGATDQDNTEQQNERFNPFGKGKR